MLAAPGAPTALLGPFVRRREFILAGLVTAIVAALVLAIGPAPGDAPAHLYRTLLVRDGIFVWDNFWYAGNYPLASYSLLYYLPAALVGNLPLVFAAAVVSTMLFVSIALREWGKAALWPSRAFGVLAAAPVYTGLYSYTLGFAAMLAALKALQLRRTWLAIVCAALTVGFSPLAFAFLCLILAAFVRPRIWRRTLPIFAGLIAIGGVEAAVLTLFPSPGVYPFHAIDFAGVIAVTTLGALVARRAPGGRPLVAFYALWGLGSVIVFAVPSPLGDNWTRLSAFVFPLMLITAALADFRPRRLVLLALATALAYNLTPYLLLIPYRLDGRPAKAAFWQPAIEFLQRHPATGFRVEVVPTSAHWESYWIPRAGFPLARGWYRQLDETDNPQLFSKHLGPAVYRRWLRANAVRYVLLPATELDATGGPQEANVLHSPKSGLRVVFRSSSWTIYQLPHATPLVTGPGRARVTWFGHTTISGRVSSPGRYLLRAHYNPYWSISGSGCVGRGPARMTWLQLPSAGAFTIRVPNGPVGLIAGANSHQSRC
ncbi:MAG TPA: hypothetical protein VIJ70_07135 [Gaiellaceae bacterium]